MSSKFEQRAARLRRELAERVPPLKLGPVGPAPSPVSPARRAAVLAQLAHELLFGGSRESGPFPSVGLHPRVADLRRRQALGDPTFAQLEAQIAADPGAGPRLFASDWGAVAHVFTGGSAPRPKKRAPLESTDLAQWRRARWEAFLASDEGRAAIEAGRLVPAVAGTPTSAEATPAPTTPTTSASEK